MDCKLSERLQAYAKMLWQRLMSFFNRCFWPLLFFLLFAAVLIPLIPSLWCSLHSCCLCLNSFWIKFLKLLDITFLLCLVISVCSKLTDIFSLKRKEKGITYSQIAILCAIGLWIVGTILILNVQKDTALATVLGVIGAALAWIFQDRIKGAFIFIHFRWNKQLNIDDWIQIPKLGVDGEIKRVTLTTVTLSNWDTTTSTIPISALQSEHFINLQNMSKGKTYGRRMVAEFTIDTSWIHPIDADEMALFLSDKHDFKDYLPKDEVKEGALNIQLYRLYLYHWLMENSHISQRPNLLVRWLEQKESGMVLQVYAFLTDSRLAAFEWQKSRIIEHIIESMGWFGIRLYQSPSAYDAGNTNVYMTTSPAAYKIEKV